MLARLIFLLQNTVGIENVTLSRIALRYYRECDFKIRDNDNGDVNENGKNKTIG